MTKEELARDILALFIDADEKHEAELSRDEIEMDLETRVVALIADVLPDAHQQLTTRAVPRYAYPEWCRTCGMTPGEGYRAEGCEDCRAYMESMEVKA